MHLMNIAKVTSRNAMLIYMYKHYISQCHLTSLPQGWSAALSSPHLLPPHLPLHPVSACFPSLYFSLFSLCVYIFFFLLVLFIRFQLLLKYTSWCMFLLIVFLPPLSFVIKNLSLFKFFAFEIYIPFAW